MKEPNIVLWDIETLPDMDEVMKIFPSIGAWPGRTFKATISTIICVGWKKLGSKQTHCINAWDFKKRWKANVNDDYEVVKAAYDVLSKADAIVTHNGKKFDLKFLNTRLMAHKLPPLGKIPHIDTTIVAKRISLYSNRLNDVSSFIGGKGKLENGGWGLWVKTRKRDKAAMKLMERYCKQDVRALEEVYNGLLPLIKENPNYNFFLKTGSPVVCPNCGSEHLHKHGTRVTTTGIKQRYQCQGCGTVSTINTRNIAKPEGV